MDESSLQETQKFMRVDVKGKTVELWQTLRHKLIQAITEVLDTVLDEQRGTTVRDEMQQFTTALLDYAKANLAKPGLENEKLEAEVRRLYRQMEVDRAQARKTDAEADALEFNNKVKRLRLVLGATKAFMLGEPEEEAIVFTAQIESFLETLKNLA